MMSLNIPPDVLRHEEDKWVCEVCEAFLEWESHKRLKSVDFGGGRKQ